MVGWDPVVKSLDGVSGVHIAATAEEALEGADAAVVVTEWQEVTDLEWTHLTGSMARPVVIDGRNALDPELMAVAGYTYEGIGRLPGLGIAGQEQH